MTGADDFAAGDEQLGPDEMQVAWDEGQTSEFTHALILFMLAHLEVADHADRKLAPMGMHRTHHRILFLCIRCPGCTVGEVGRTLRLTPQAVQTPMRELLRKGLIEQRVSETDKRQRRLFVTQAGREVQSQLADAQFRLLQKARDAVGEIAFSNFLETMRALSRPADLSFLDRDGEDLLRG